MRAIMLALSLAFVASAVQAQTAASSKLDLSTPQEVGNTSMPPGNYVVTEQTSGKSYNLMVSSKGTMILAPATKAATQATAAATTAVAPAGGGIVPGAPAAGAVVAIPPGAMAPAGATNSLAGMLNNRMASGAMKGLMNSGVKQIEKNAGKQITNLLK